LGRLMAVFKQYAVEDSAPVRRAATLKTAPATAARPVARNLGLAPGAPDENKFTRF